MKWDAKTDEQKIAYLRCAAEQFRALKPEPDEKVMSPQEWADALDEIANCIEAGEEEAIKEEIPEQLSEAEALHVAEMERSLTKLLKRWVRQRLSHR